MMVTWKKAVALKMMRNSGGSGGIAEIWVMRFAGGMNARYKKDSHG